jgi:signal transduction histidine kinase
LYLEALESYLGEGGEGALRQAYELGRRAIGESLGVLEIASLHHEALASLLPRRSRSAPLARQLGQAGEFLAEALSSYEMARRGVLDAVAALRQLNETMECEIQRIAHAVHDEAGQLLDAARLVMFGFGDDVAPPVQLRLRQLGAILDQAERELRRLSHELRPTLLDDLGLVPALRFLAAGVTNRTSVSVVVESTVEVRQPARIETAVYRIVQEALANVTRHSRAANVRVRLVYAKAALHCVVQDDGTGFDVASVLARTGEKGLGLVAIRERLNAVGGNLQIHSERGRGTELAVSIPLER